MEALFEALEAIEDLLEQIQTITQNQMTILLDSAYMGDGLDMIEQMATFKEGLTTQVETTEATFQALYSKHKVDITEAIDKKRLKDSVDHIMRLKAYIIEQEQKNVFILQDLLRRMQEPIELPKNAKQVAKAYESHKK